MSLIHKTTTIIILALLLTAFGFAQTAKIKWRAANFRGMAVGRSKLTNAVRAWGKPKWSRNSSHEEEDEEPQVTWTNYDRLGEFPGSTTVVSDTRSGVITRINFYPDKLTKEQAIAHFGRGYIITKYAFDYCLAGEDSEAIYESTAGPLVIMEYRTRGIAVYLGDKDLVTRISYVANPIGSPKSRCNP